MPANVIEDAGLIAMLTQNIDYFRTKPEQLPKTTISLNHGYRLNTLQQAAERIYPKIMSKIS